MVGITDADYIHANNSLKLLWNKKVGEYYYFNLKSDNLNLNLLVGVFENFRKFII